MSLHIFKKELREMFRDKRVINGAFVAPIFLIVLMLLLFGSLEKSLSKPKPPTLHIVNAGSENSIVKTMRDSKGMKVVIVDSLEDGIAKIQAGDAKLVLQFPEDFDAKIASGQAKIEARYDEDEVMSKVALGAVSQAFEAANAKIVEAKLAENSLPKEFAQPILLDSKPAPRKERMGSGMIIGMLPYLIVIWAFYGGFSTVSDMVAGEKERGTMETLLITPATRSQIAMGKFWALTVICLLSSLTSLIGVIVIGVLNLPLTQSLFPEGLRIPVLAMVAILISLIPLVMLFSGVLLAVSALAKNMREAQTYLTLVSFVVIMPAIFSQFIGFTDMAKASWVPFVPILNTAVVIRNALLSKIVWSDVLISAVVAGAIAWAMIMIVVGLFSRESIVART
ncbi:MAG: ABC transporter permease protein NatB [Fimbriimonadaceae bacterium]|nr:ABC transporter permease protein NatB [Fimbriimonadaceae bacterium]